jgi:ribosome-associated protein
VDDELLQIDDKVSIPRSELSFRFSRSSGPGGQHVQKSSTRVELLFDLANSPSLTDAQSERSQWQNREEVVARFEALMGKALKRRRRRRPTQPTAASKERRLRQKRRRSEIKRDRGGVRQEE